MSFDKFVSTSIAQQFPEFYREEGQNFVAFVRGYYEWMEQEGYAINASKSLLEYKDIDQTIDQFTSNFKEEFLVNFPSITAANKKFLAKRIKDFYQAKGSNKGLELLFRLLFDDDITVYTPGIDILRASDGIWKIPTYIEVEHIPSNKDFVNQQITGSKTSATAFVESIHTTIINKRLIDIVNLSSIVGEFEYGELITYDGDLSKAPKITGSLTSISIVDGGANNSVGDVFNIQTTSDGKYGSAKVVSTEDGTGRVTFTLVDGGSGYTNSASQVHVSETVLFTSNRQSTNGNYDFVQFGKVSQPLINVQYTVSSPSNPNTSILYHSQVTGYSGNTQIASGYIVDVSSPNNVVINITSGDFSLSDTIATTGNSVLFTGYSSSNTTATGIITGLNSTAIGLHSLHNTFHANGSYIEYVTNTSIVTANVDTISTGSGAKFQVGSLVATQSVSVFTDVISSNNINGIDFSDIILCGSNSNTALQLGTGVISTNTSSANVIGVGTTFSTELIVGSGVYNNSNTFVGTVNSISNSTFLTLTSNAATNSTSVAFRYNLNEYGFVKNYAAGINSRLIDALSFGNFNIGTIASLSSINPGNNYNTPPFVAIRNDAIAAYNRKNIILYLNNKTGPFGIGDTITQTYTTPTTLVTYNSNTGNFVVGEAIYQSSTNTYATIMASNSNIISVSNIRGSLATNSNILGLSSNTSANVSALSGSTTSSIAKGSIVNILDPNTIELRRVSFNESFSNNTTVYSSSGGQADVIYVTQDDESSPMGFNAVVSDNVSIARGIATELQILDSGYGYQPGEELILSSNTNQFAISGIANVHSKGIGIGYWENNQGKLNSDKYIIDSTYYQDYSYEIQSRLSMDKYADILKKLAHVVGTKMFGKVMISSATNKNFIPVESIIALETVPLGQLNFSIRENSILIAALGM
jgi:hypothetical protein